MSKSTLQFKVKTDILKIIGVAFCSPFCIRTLNFLLTTEKLSDILDLKMIISLTIFALGYLAFVRAIVVGEEVDNALNRIYK